MKKYTGTASKSLYKANGFSVLRLSMEMKVRMATMAERKAKMEPTQKKGISAVVKSGRDFKRSYPAAPVMMGTAAIKEYSAATSRRMPRIIPPMSVEAERENPGQRARHWKQPMPKA